MVEGKRKIGYRLRVILVFQKYLLRWNYSDSSESSSSNGIALSQAHLVEAFANSENVKRSDRLSDSIGSIFAAEEGSHASDHNGEIVTIENLRHSYNFFRKLALVFGKATGWRRFDASNSTNVKAERSKFSLKNLSLKVHDGQAYGLLGFNGAGKSTFFKCVVGDALCYSGKISVRGKCSIGYCPQGDAFNHDLTPHEVLTLYARLKGGGWRNNYRVQHFLLPGLHQPELQASIWLTKMGLVDDVPSGQLSGGNKRKLSSAIALIGFPNIVLLDEPTTGMDPKSRHLLKSAVTELLERKRERAVLMTSHTMTDVKSICENLAIIQRGNLCSEGSPLELQKKWCKDKYVLKIYGSLDAMGNLVRCLETAKVEVSQAGRNCLLLNTAGMVGDVVQHTACSLTKWLLEQGVELPDFEITLSGLEEVSERFY